MPKNSFAIIAKGSQNRFTRKWGTEGSKVVEPYVTGYHFIYWQSLPSKLSDNVSINANPAKFSSNSEIANVLAGLCLAVTIPGLTVNKTDFQGLGGMSWTAPTGIVEDNNCNMRFLETSGLPIYHIFHGWVRMIRDYRAGISNLASDSQYMKSNYAATVFYWTTEPNGKIVEYHSCLAGLYPLKDPRDSFSHDIASNDKLEIDIDFAVDRVFSEAWTYNKCQAYANQYYMDSNAAGSEYAPGGGGSGGIGGLLSNVGSIISQAGTAVENITGSIQNIKNLF